MAHDKNMINSFRSHVDYIESYVANGDHFEALQAIKLLSLNIGETFWGVQMRISLEQLTGGLEAQKAYSEELKKVHRSGVLSFIAFYTSMRNEEHLSWRRFQETINDRLDRSSYSDPVKRYLRYRLLLEWPQTKSGIADVLRLEQSQSSIDLYETFVRLLQHLSVNDGFESYKEILTNALNTMSGIDDFRLKKLQCLLTANPSQLNLERRDNARRFDKNKCICGQPPLLSP